MKDTTGVEPVPATRGIQQVAIMAEIMRHEMADNVHKGHWLTVEGEDVERNDEDLLGDLLYHAAKLGLAVATGNKVAMLEYAADVGNCAWFVADKHDALRLELTHDGAVEYDDDIEQIATSKTFADFRELAHQFARDILATPPPR